MKILELSLMCSFNSIQYCFTTQGMKATSNAMGSQMGGFVQRTARPQTVRRCFGFFSVLYILQYYSLIWNFQYYSLICNFSHNVAMAAARGAAFWPVLPVLASLAPEKNLSPFQNIQKNARKLTRCSSTTDIIIVIIFGPDWQINIYEH